MLALLALVASVLIWAAPSSQAQNNQAPNAVAVLDVAGSKDPGTADVGLNGTGSFDVDSSANCGDCTFKWEVETGPYDWITIENDTNADTAQFDMPSEAFVDKVNDDDPQKFVINIRLTVTDNRGATDSDTVSVNINRRPVADIQLYAGLRDRTLLDPDASTKERYSIPAVIDGPGENGNRDNEWDIMEGAYVQLDASGSTDEDPTVTLEYTWTQVLVTPSGTSDIRGTQARSTTAQFEVGDLAEPTTLSDDSVSNVEVLPDVAPNAPVTVVYSLTAHDNSRDGTSIIRIVVHDASTAPAVSIGLGNRAAVGQPGRGLSDTSFNEGDAKPQSTVAQITGVENQFIVAAGSTVQLAATVKVGGVDMTTAAGYTYRWSGATQVGAVAVGDTAVHEPAEARVRIPANAEDGDTIDVSVTVIDNARRTPYTTPIQLLVGKNTPPTAGGVQANQGSIDADGNPLLYVHSITDGFQNPRDGSTVTLRGVGNDADGDSIITAWALREGPSHSALTTAIKTWLDNKDADKAAADLAALATVPAALADMREPKQPLFELNGALTDTVSFEVPNLETGTDKGTLLLFSVIDSNGVADAQIVFVYVNADNNSPAARAGDDQQVAPGAFVRLNGSGSSDPDVDDSLKYRWTYVGATMDPAPNQRAPLSTSEITELDGWILEKTATGFDYIVNSDGELLAGKSSNNLKAADTAYAWFDAPKLTGFNDVKLTFRLAVFDDEAARDVDGDGATDNSNVSTLSEVTLGMDLNGDGDKLDAAITTVDEAQFGLDLDSNLVIDNALDLANTAVDEATIRAFATDTVTIAVTNRFFSDNIPGPNYCFGQSLGGPQTYPFDRDRDGVADTCSLNTTRRATVARQNALETLANLSPGGFRSEVLAVCDAPGFKATNYGDDPDDLANDVCETRRVSPPPRGADPATADVFFSGTIPGADFCTNFSLGGARTYANDADGDGVADQCSLATTKREAIARQRALETFIVTFSAAEAAELAGLSRLVDLSDDGSAARGTDNTQVEYNNLFRAHVDATLGSAVDAGDLNPAQKATADARIAELTAKRDGPAARYSNALAAECRALGTQDFGDAASALARDECVPRPSTGSPLS